MGDEVKSVIDRGKFSILESSKEETTEDSTYINEIRLQIGLRLTSTSDGIFLHVTTKGETKTTQLTPESTDPLTLDLYNWAQTLVQARTYT